MIVRHMAKKSAQPVGNKWLKWNLGNDKTQLVTDLLRFCYGKTGVMDFGHKPVVRAGIRA